MDQSAGHRRPQERGGLGTDYRGAAPSPGGDADSQYWEERPPGEMVEIAGTFPAGKRFDAVVVDDEYWATFWDEDQVCYGHVLGFKGLERRVVVLAVNDTSHRDRARERLYVGLPRP